MIKTKRKLNQLCKWNKAPLDLSTCAKFLKMNKAEEFGRRKVNHPLSGSGCLGVLNERKLKRAKNICRTKCLLANCNKKMSNYSGIISGRHGSVDLGYTYLEWMLV